MEEFFNDNGVVDVYLEVRVSNTPARTLYEKIGFRAIGVQKNYYRFPAEDAIVMNKHLDKGLN
jgi:ribosomal-protein-alanine N-acetyltransferase